MLVSVWNEDMRKSVTRLNSMPIIEIDKIHISVLNYNDNKLLFFIVIQSV